MKILLSPAETKISGGVHSPFCKNNFSFTSLFDKREYILAGYEDFIKRASMEELKQWFGLKNEDEIKRYGQILKTKPTMKAIQRYTGVAFDALNYNKLDSIAQHYIDKNVFLFSNLFGPIRADDYIPDYKYKQGAKLPKIRVENFYKENFSQVLEDVLGDEIIDLRAGFYDKFYTPQKAEVVTFKFLKEGKVISHWAKYYRGKILQMIANRGIETISSFIEMPMEGLNLIEIQEKKNIKLLIMDLKNNI